MIVRKAKKNDINFIAEIYEKIHDAEERGDVIIGWVRGIYPERKTAEDALERGDLFVLEDGGKIVGTAILNKRQLPEYYGAAWEFPAADEEVMVMHTLVIDPFVKGRGYGRFFENFYEKYALENGCRFLRIDTNKRNETARRFYARSGYKEIGIIRCDFNKIRSIDLVMLEKKL